MVKPIADSSKAVGFFNREQGFTISVNLRHWFRYTATARDLRVKKDRGSFTTDVPEHGVVRIR